MRRNAVTAALSLLACLLFCTAPLLARPTRTIPRAPARRLVPTQPVARATRLRATHTTLSAHAASRTPARPERIASTSVRTPASSRRQTPSRAADRALGRERARASQSAIATANRGLHTRTPSVPTYVQRPAARSTPPPPSEEASATDTSSFTNVGGALLPAAPGVLPLRSIEEEASTPVLLPPLRVSSLYDSHGHLIVPRPLYGTHEILLHQNEMADRDGSDRVRDDADLLDLRREKKLVALPENETIHVDFRLPEDRRYSRPWTAAFLTVLAADYYAAFQSPLQIDSAVRTIAVQQRLVRTNGNAAPITGDTASPHLTGQAVDIAKGGLNRTQIAWLRTYLQPLISQGKIDVEEEFQQACFHISVYRNFLPIAPGRTIAAASRQPTPQPLPERPNE